jgi:hypothetical protein
VIVLMLGSLAASLAGIIRNPDPPGLLLAMTLLVVAAVLFPVVGMHRRKVVLSEDGIEVTRLFGTQTMARADIAARRMGRLSVHAGGGRYHIMIGRDERELALPPFLDFDAAFHAWMSGIPLVRYRPRSRLGSHLPPP